MYTRPLDDVSAPNRARWPRAAEGTVEAIRTDGLTRTFPSRSDGSLTAVDHLGLSVRAGEIFGLLGPRGAGKTTTVGMLTTRVVPSSGRALVGGVDIVAEPALAKQVIGVVPQSNTLDRELTVWQTLYFHGRYFGMPAPEAKEEAGRLLEQFRLTDRAKARRSDPFGGNVPETHGGPGDLPPPTASSSWMSPRRASTPPAASPCGRSSPNSTPRARGIRDVPPTGAAPPARE